MGGLSMETVDCGNNIDSIRFSTELTHQSLHDLCNGDILVIRVPNYYSSIACEKILSNPNEEEKNRQYYIEKSEDGCCFSSVKGKKK